MAQDTKMRIKLYDKKGNLTSDRLVEQSIECNIGPKIKHEGPISLEINLPDRETIPKIITYIEKLTGSLPIEPKTKKVRLRNGTLELDHKEPLEDLMKAALQKAENQEGLIKFLREQGFRFIDGTVITELVPELKEQLQLKPKHEGYQWMIRLVKEAKDPRKDKWDYRLLFGIKIVGEKTDKVVIYLFGKFHSKAIIPWKKENKINFKKVDRVMVFPEHMDYDDRKKWRIEHVRLLNASSKGTQIKPTKFYIKNAKFIKLNGVNADEWYNQNIAKVYGPIPEPES